MVVIGARTSRATSEEGTTMADHPARAPRVTSSVARRAGARAAALACGGVLLLAGCGGPDRPTAEATTSSRLRTPAETCALQVGYWAGELLKPNHDKGYDYQEMGLTTADYQIVLDITKDAKRLQRTATREQTLAFVAREAQRRCAGHGTTTCTAATNAGWPC